MPLAAPEISEGDRLRVSAALVGASIAYGPTVDEFERKLASDLDLGQGVAVISGTAALHLALLAVGVEPGDLVAMPSLTFVAPAHAVRYVGAQPLLFDSEPDYRQLDVPRTIAWLEDECSSHGTETIHNASGRRVGALLPVDLLGHACDVEPLAAAAREMSIPVVEDGAQGLGATLRGRPIGAHADVTCLSFNANKIITSGGGGMLLSKDEALIRRVRHLANQAKVAGPDYVHSEVGFNYRLPSAQAALGLSQFERLDEFLDAKAGIARHYERELAGLPGLTMPRHAPEATATNWLFTIHVAPDRFGQDAHLLMGRLGDEHGIETRPIFSPLHSRGAYEGLEAERCEVAEGLAATGLSLPSSVSLTAAELDRVCEGIRAESGR